MSSRAEPITVDVSEEPGGVIAICWAAREAARRHSPLRLVFAQAGWRMSPSAASTYAGVGRPTGPVAEPAVDLAFQLVAALEPTVDVSAYVRPVSPVQLLLNQSRRAGMVVLANPGGGVLDDMLGGTVCGTLATHASCPVIAVNGRPAWPDAPVVVGITEPETDLQAIEFGFDVADRWGVSLTLHQVGNDLRQQRQVCEAVVRFARDRIARAGRCADVEVSWQVSVGDPVTALSDAAAAAQLLVMAAPAHGPAMSLVTGSITHTLLRTPPCPIAVIPPNWPPPMPPTDGRR
ncbi:MAG TPA: universal stress protein [Pseudonocardiaceae bacterium]|nr:universal stress protein [Pseudonocardiaceae bacterium]